MCFPIYKGARGGWFLVPHDELLEIVGDCTGWLKTQAWARPGTIAVEIRPHC